MKYEKNGRRIEVMEVSDSDRRYELLLLKGYKWDDDKKVLWADFTWELQMSDEQEWLDDEIECAAAMESVRLAVEEFVHSKTG